MAKDPAFLFYSSDFLTGTLTLNFEDRGRYITILCLMHQQGRLQEDTIRFVVGFISDSLRSKFSIDESGNWYNPRLEDEVEKRKHFTESRRNNGKKGGRKPNAIPNDIPIGLPTTNLTENENENENENINELSKGVVGGNIIESRPLYAPPKGEVQRVFIQQGGTMEMAEHFYNKYEAIGWVLNGSPVKQWGYLVKNFIINWKNNNNAKNTHTSNGRNDLPTELTKGF
jgi:hypothetical protein